MGKKSKQTPGVRTKLNSGEKKVKKMKASGEHNVPNPTAQVASQKLPDMTLSTDTNWVAETSSTVMLSTEGTMASERTVQSDNITYMPVEIPQDLELPDEIKNDIAKKVKENKEKQEKAAASKAKLAAQSKNNKYKMKAEDNNIIDNIKTYISSVSEDKIDYAKLNQIQEELHGKFKHVKSKIADNMEAAIDTASSMVSSGEEQLDKIKQALKANIEEAKLEKEKQRLEAETKTQTTKSKAADAQQETAKTIIPEKEAENPELTRALQSEKSAKAALDALNEQMSNTSDDTIKKDLQEKIDKKQKQLETAQEKVKKFKLDLNG